MILHLDNEDQDKKDLPENKTTSMKKKSSVTFIDKLVRLVALAFAIALVLGAMAGHIDPRDNKYIPFFGLAYPYILVINLFMLGWWVLRKRWILFLFTLIVIASGWQAFRATIRFSGDAGEGPKKSIDLVRMMTYNVHGFKPFDTGAVEPVKQQILSIVRKENPDIIAFQEYFTRKKGSFDMTDSLKGILKTPYYYFVADTDNGYEATGLAIFSKYPIESKGSIAFADSGNSSIYIDVLINKKMMRIYSVHLQSIAFDKQDYEYLDKVTSKMDPDLKPSKRILSMLKTAFLKRSAQVDVMKAEMKKCTTPFLIAGDFNDTPPSYAVTQLTKGMNKSFDKKGTGLGRTYNGKFPNFQIDYIATTKDIEIMNHRVITAKLSDHFPVRSDLKLTP